MPVAVGLIKMELVQEHSRVSAVRHKHCHAGTNKIAGIVMNKTCWKHAMCITKPRRNAKHHN